MVNDLRELMQRHVEHPPHDDTDLTAVLRAGRRRVRVRRAGVAGAAALATAAVVVVTSLVFSDPSPVSLDAAGVPRPEGPVLRLGEATEAVEGRDYRVLASYTNENLDRDNGQYLDGVTDDGLILFRDGPRAEQLFPRLALMDPTTREKDWLPELGVGQTQLYPLELGSDRLVLVGVTDGGPDEARVAAHVFDRSSRSWSMVKWPTLPAVQGVWSTQLGPDGRVYALVPATRGEVPEGGWPTGPGGEAEDADAEGDTYALWSASLEDPADVRDEGLLVGDVAFTDEAMVWTDSTNGAAGRVHVRDLATGEEASFDPRSGERCNLLAFGAVAERIVMSQYCGTYDDGVRDDRVQVLSTEGDLVTTLQGSGVEGALAGPGNSLLAVTSYEPARSGTYAYDLETDRFWRLSDDVASWSFGSMARDGELFWTTPVNRGRGATQWLGELLP